MQNITIAFVERLQKRMETGAVSIASALEHQLESMEVRSILQVRDAALDLARVCELAASAKLPDDDDPKWHLGGPNYNRISNPDGV